MKKIVVFHLGGGIGLHLGININMRLIDFLKKIFRSFWGLVKAVFWVTLFLILVYFMFRGIGYMAENYPITKSQELLVLSVAVDNCSFVCLTS
jgi:type III secretory pathway component EscU